MCLKDVFAFLRVEGKGSLEAQMNLSFSLSPSPLTVPASTHSTKLATTQRIQACLERQVHACWRDQSPCVSHLSPPWCQMGCVHLQQVFRTLGHHHIRGCDAEARQRLSFCGMISALFREGRRWE